MIEHTGAEVLMNHLISTGVVSRSGSGRPWPATFNHMPEQPNDAVALYDTQGRMDGRMMRSGTVVEFPGVMVRIRSKTYSAGAQIAFRIIQKIDAILNAIVVVGAAEKQYKIDSVQRTSSLLPLGQEEGGSRELISINGLISYGEYS